MTCLCRIPVELQSSTTFFKFIEYQCIHTTGYSMNTYLWFQQSISRIFSNWSTVKAINRKFYSYSEQPISSFETNRISSHTHNFGPKRAIPAGLLWYIGAWATRITMTNFQFQGIQWDCNEWDWLINCIHVYTCLTIHCHKILLVTFDSVMCYL